MLNINSLIEYIFLPLLLSEKETPVHAFAWHFVWTFCSSSSCCWVGLHWNALDGTFRVNSIFYNPYPVIQWLSFQLRVLLFQSSWKWSVIRGGDDDNGWVLWLVSENLGTSYALNTCAHSFCVFNCDIWITTVFRKLKPANWTRKKKKYQSKFY